ncbi:hypothetical protein ACFORL_02015 [Legionella dresdenensis]|uniref:Ankyrin repeats (3 copies) n=1 Tax=Legionella dresdenensis TaxID=450200 RepID=A0ABV8CCN0_9GAMM
MIALEKARFDVMKSLLRQHCIPRKLATGRLQNVDPLLFVLDKIIEYPKVREYIEIFCGIFSSRYRPSMYGQQPLEKLDEHNPLFFNANFNPAHTELMIRLAVRHKATTIPYETRNHMFVQAAERQNEGLIKFYLQYDNKFSLTEAISLAEIQRKQQAVDYLIDNFLQNNYIASVIGRALYKSLTELIKRIISKKTFHIVWDQVRHMLVHELVADDKLDLLKSLLETYSGMISIVEKGRHGWTPVEIAIDRGNIPMVEYLLSLEPLQLLPGEHSALAFAVKRLRCSVASYLVDNYTTYTRRSILCDYDSLLDLVFSALSQNPTLALEPESVAEIEELCWKLVSLGFNSNLGFKRHESMLNRHFRIVLATYKKTYEDYSKLNSAVFKLLELLAMFGGAIGFNLTEEQAKIMETFAEAMKPILAFNSKFPDNIPSILRKKLILDEHDFARLSTLDKNSNLQEELRHLLNINEQFVLNNFKFIKIPFPPLTWNGGLSAIFHQIESLLDKFDGFEVQLSERLKAANYTDHDQVFTTLFNEVNQIAHNLKEQRKKCLEAGDKLNNPTKTAHTLAQEIQYLKSVKDLINKLEFEANYILAVITIFSSDETADLQAKQEALSFIKHYQAIPIYKAMRMHLLSLKTGDVSGDYIRKCQCLFNSMHFRLYQEVPSLQFLSAQFVLRNIYESDAYFFSKIREAKDTEQMNLAIAGKNDFDYKLSSYLSITLLGAPKGLKRAIEQEGAKEKGKECEEVEHRSKQPRLSGPGSN